MAVKTTTILTTLSLDDVSLHENETSEKVEVKDEGIDISKTSVPISKELILLSRIIEVKEKGCYIVDGNLNVGMAVESPSAFGLGLANE